ncbi:MAG: GT4 family glycosyltransferase PelF [Deltaproteobacteria bacterium]|nr:GT4 family glycosyltransferase PelF [Deltaproteobacteria bacterium]
MSPTSDAHVTLILEGTYPYVAGGVSSWVHEIVCSLPELSFALDHLGAQRETCGAPLYDIPGNVAHQQQRFLHVAEPAPEERERQQAELMRRIREARRSPRRSSRLLAALQRFHADDAVDDELIAGLAERDLSVDELLHGDAAFDAIVDVYRAVGGGASFVDFFWHFRAAHVPLVRLLREDAPPSRVYHAVSTGYAGVIAAVASQRTGRPMLLTEHGLYARERDMELARAAWIREPELDLRIPVERTSPLRRFWSRFFRRMSSIAYHRAARIVTLSDVNLRHQLADGADAARTAVVANGVDTAQLVRQIGRPVARGKRDPVRVCFVGRVVPIKDVVTFVKACDLAMREVPLAARIVGPTQEDPAYAARVRDLIAALGRDSDIRLEGPMPLKDIYRSIDLLVLTSISEGQPLVMLEAHALGIPCIATDVGACREILEGRDDADRRLGPSGIVTPVAAPEDTAAAMVQLARDRKLRRRMGATGRARILARYAKHSMIDSYRAMYRELGAS